MRGLPGDDSDEQARWSGDVVGKTPFGSVASIPNGTLRLVQNLIINWRGGTPVQSCPDGGECPHSWRRYNIIPQAEDAARPEAWREDPVSPRIFIRLAQNPEPWLTEAFRAQTSGPNTIVSGIIRPARGIGMMAFVSITF